MSVRIRPLAESDLDAFVEIMATAYPGLKIVSDADRQGMRDRLATSFENTETNLYGLVENGQLLAGMILYDFIMNFRGEMLLVGGLGSLAVDLLHRKRKLAKKMVSFYLDHFREKGAGLALLYPFRPDFYRRMGFGYGTQMNHYVFRPEGLRVTSTSRQHILYLAGEDAGQVLACYDRYARANHGMILGSRWRTKQMLANPAMRTVGFVNDGQILGYVTFDFENQANFLMNDLRIRQMIWQDSNVLMELLAFLRSLADQCERIVYNTQERAFYHLLDDPRNRTGDLIPSVYHTSNTQGVGLMYRVIDPNVLFGSTAVRFGQQDITLKINLTDSFRPENEGDMIVHFEGGTASLVDSQAFDAHLQLDVSDFSSLLMGTVAFDQLAAYGLAQLSNPEQIERINSLFLTDKEPICMTAF